MLVAVGGHSRKIGKTSVLAGLISALPEAQWTAIKVSANRSRGGADQPCVLTEESASAPEGDSSRYLAAGALRSFWLRASDVQLSGALAAFDRIVAGSWNVIVESNRLVLHRNPDLYLSVLDFAVEDFKDSSRTLLDRADAFVLVERGLTSHPWAGVPAGYFDSRTVFRVPPGAFVSSELIAFVKQKLDAASAAVTRNER